MFVSVRIEKKTRESRKASLRKGRRQKLLSPHPSPPGGEGERSEGEEVIVTAGTSVCGSVLPLSWQAAPILDTGWPAR
jgi:hypothetical protein